MRFLVILACLVILGYAAHDDSHKVPPVPVPPPVPPPEPPICPGCYPVNSSQILFTSPTRIFRHQCDEKCYKKYFAVSRAGLACYCFDELNVNKWSPPEQGKCNSRCPSPHSYFCGSQDGNFYTVCRTSPKWPVACDRGLENSPCPTTCLGEEYFDEFGRTVASSSDKSISKAIAVLGETAPNITTTTYGNGTVVISKRAILESNDSSVNSTLDIMPPEVDKKPCIPPSVRYYFDRDTRTCRAFMWVGCEANRNTNNFLKFEDCKNTCVKDFSTVPGFDHLPELPKNKNETETSGVHCFCKKPHDRAVCKRGGVWVIDGVVNIKDLVKIECEVHITGDLVAPEGDNDYTLRFTSDGLLVVSGCVSIGGNLLYHCEKEFVSSEPVFIIASKCSHGMFQTVTGSGKHDGRKLVSYVTTDGVVVKVDDSEHGDGHDHFEELTDPDHQESLAVVYDQLEVKNGLGPGPIVGIVCAAIVGAAIMGFVGYTVYRRQA